MEEAETAAIEFRDVTKLYGRFRALDNLSFSIPEGSITGFVGPNGAGKTTSIRLMAGLLIPDSGSIAVAGESPYSSIRMREKVFYIMDTVNIPPHLTVYEYMIHLSRIYSFDSRRIKDAFQSLDLWGYRERRVKQLSAGMKQKAQLALALCANAEVIIADEPASNMDPVARMQLYDTIRTINKDRGTTFFISSHILTELEKIIGHVVIISHGRKLVQSSVSEAMEKTLKRTGVDTVRITVSDVATAMRIVNAVSVEGNTLVVKTEEGLFGRLVTALEKNGVTILSVERQKFDLSGVFSEVVSGEQGN